MPVFDVGLSRVTHQRQARSFKCEQDAFDFLATVQVDKRLGSYLDPALGDITFAAVAQEWLAVLATQRPKTINGYVSLLNTHVLPFFGAKAVATIKPHDVRSFLAHMSRQGAAAGTVRNAYRVLKPVLDTAVDMGCVRTNPCGPLRRGALPHGGRSEMRALTATQVAHLAANTTAPYDALVLLAAYTGMRAGEIAALRMENVDLGGGRIRVVESISETGGKVYVVPPKTGEQRDVILPQFLVSLLRRHIEAHPPVWGYLFTSPPRRAHSGSASPDHHRLRHNGWLYPKVFLPATFRADLAPLRFHDLRHTCASLLIAKNVHMKAISRQLGHSSIAITMDRYGHLLPSVEESMARALDEVFADAGTAEPNPPSPPPGPGAGLLQ